MSELTEQTPDEQKEARERVVNGLRELADFLDAHPEVPAPKHGVNLYPPIGADYGGTPTMIAAFLDGDTDAVIEFDKVMKAGSVTRQFVGLAVCLRAIKEDLLSEPREAVCVERVPFTVEELTERAGVAGMH
jgi:hypothetical protein